MLFRSIFFACVVGSLSACAPVVESAAPAHVLPQHELTRHEQSIGNVLDDFHDAAAKADENRYFGHFTEDAIFLGTDATERWTKAEFQTWSKPFFKRGKAWSFHKVRRAIHVDGAGAIAWFDEDLETDGLGPSRGSGVLVAKNGTWLIAQYNLAITVPNDRLDSVKKLLVSVVNQASE